MALAEKQHVTRREVIAVGKCQVGVAYEPLVHIGDGRAGIAGGVDKGHLYLGMIDEETEQFAGCVARASYDSGPDHSSRPLRFCTL